MTLQRARLHEAGGEGSRTHFARGLDALPDAEETDQPDEQEAESEVPLQRARLVNPGRQAQNLPPSSKQSPKSDGLAGGRESRTGVPRGCGSARLQAAESRGSREISGNPGFTESWGSQPAGWAWTPESGEPGFYPARPRAS